MEIVKTKEKEQTASHPVDPLLSEVFRGVMVNMFPYPIVENATIKHGIEARSKKERFTKTVALPEKWELPKIEKLYGGRRSIII